MELFIPKVKLKTTHFPKWFSPKIHHHLKRLLTLHRKLHHHFTLTSLQRLIQLEDLTQHEIFNAKENYEEELVNSSYVNSKDPKLFPGSLPSVLKKDSVKAVSDGEKAQLL